MTIITQEQVEKLRAAGVAVPDVNETCIGCSACVAISPDVFELNDEGISEVIEPESIQNLNKKYRNINTVTDVLSFHYHEDFS